jgi:hypothetical protein
MIIYALTVVETDLVHSNTTASVPLITTVPTVNVIKN